MAGEPGHPCDASDRVQGHGSRGTPPPKRRPGQQNPQRLASDGDWRERQVDGDLGEPAHEPRGAYDEENVSYQSAWKQVGED